VIIRRAKPSDSDAIAALVAQLGYPTDAGEVRVRLERLLSSADAIVMVAEEHEEVLGLITSDQQHLIYRSRPQCRITALVVRDDSRGRGIGRALVQLVETAARDRGCFRLELTTRAGRPDALPFYASLGFAERPHRLVKPLDG
jgi:GNAT superfamily N-acetyltransferase